MNKKFILPIAFSFFSSFAVSDANAYDQIIRPYQSVRSSGMGSVRITTGEYDENFFGNPARVTANPTWRVQLPDPMVETTFNTIGAASTLLGGDNLLANVADQAGKNLHSRIQFTFPGAYFHTGWFSYAFAVITSIQTDVGIRKNFNVNPEATADVGPAMTFGKEFLEETLSVGATVHATYRFSSPEGFGLTDVLQGVSLSPLKSAGDGSHIDFGVGSTYLMPGKPLGMDFTLGLSVNNVLGGAYRNLDVKFLDSSQAARRQRRAYNVGASLATDELWIFDNFIGALELTDIGNNPDGSVFKLIHIGAEAEWGILIPRVGINQGYWTAGLTIDLPVLDIEIATYGEELTTNAGGLEDRRYALRLNMSI